MGLADIDTPLTVTVAYSPAPRQLDVVELTLAPGATVALALAQSGLLARHGDVDLSTQKIGVWGHLCALDQVLRHLDRVEIYRSLLVDPKEARCLRYKRDRVTPTATSSRRR
jgi:uncharacterized protein